MVRHLGSAGSSDDRIFIFGVQSYDIEGLFFLCLGSGFSRDPISGSGFFWFLRHAPGLVNRGSRHSESM